MNELGPAQIIWPLLTIAVAIASIASVIIAAVKLNSRMPPLAEELAKNYATRDELDKEVKSLNIRIDREVGMLLSSSAEHSLKLDALIATTSQTARDTERALGRIEGKLDQHIKEHRP